MRKLEVPEEPVLVAWGSCSSTCPSFTINNPAAPHSRALGGVHDVMDAVDVPVLDLADAARKLGPWAVETARVGDGTMRRRGVDSAENLGGTRAHFSPPIRMGRAKPRPSLLVSSSFRTPQTTPRGGPRCRAEQEGPAIPSEPFQPGPETAIAACRLSVGRRCQSEHSDCFRVAARKQSTWLVNALATVVSGAHGDADILSPLSTRFADPFPTGRKFAAGIVKSFPTGRKYRKNSIDNISCLCASLRMR